MMAGRNRPFEQAGNEAGQNKEESPKGPPSYTEKDRRSEPYFWHGFANMANVDSNDELVIVRGEGCEVFDQDGRGYLDATAALWFCNVGYGRQAIVEAVEQQMRKLSAYSTFGLYANEPAEELSERISQLAPLPDSKVFLTCNGSDAIDTAAKMVRRYWSEVGKPDKQIIIGRDFAYHGMDAFGTSLAGISANAQGYGQLVPSVAQVPYDSVKALAEEFEHLGPENVAAFIGEPVIGAGGVYPPPEDYWPEVAKLCQENDVLLIADEVVTVFRTPWSLVRMRALWIRAGPARLRKGRHLRVHTSRRGSRRPAGSRAVLVGERCGI